MDSGATAAAIRQNWRGPYLKELPKDPWGNEYRLV
jgi:hypothetical protein